MIQLVMVVFLSLCSVAAFATDTVSRPHKATWRPDITAAIDRPAIRPDDALTGALVFSAPPRGSEAEERAMFDPIAAYLSTAIGKHVTYRYPGNWGVYRGAMVRDEYDIVFDGPHFNSYRNEKHRHRIVAKAPGAIEIALFVKNDRYNQIQDLAGRTICAHAPPNLGALVVLRQFNNPSRQPIITNSPSLTDIFSSVLSGKCHAGVSSIAAFEKNVNAGLLRVIFKEQALPNQAFSVAHRVGLPLQDKIAAALISEEAIAPTEKLRKAHALGRLFVPTTNSEYAGVSDLLKDEWGYY